MVQCVFVWFLCFFLLLLICFSSSVIDHYNMCIYIICACRLDCWQYIYKHLLCGLYFPVQQLEWSSVINPWCNTNATGSVINPWCNTDATARMKQCSLAGVENPPGLFRLWRCWRCWSPIFFLFVFLGFEIFLRCRFSFKDGIVR